MIGLILLAIGICLAVFSGKTAPSEAGKDNEKPGNASAAPKLEANRNESYALRGPAVKGKVIQTTDKFEFPEVAVTLQNGDKYSTGTARMANESTTRTEIVAVDNGRPIVMHVAVLRDSRTVSFTFEGMTEPMTETKKGPLEGATILIEFKNGRWVRTLMGAQPNKEQKEELQRSFVEPDVIYPTEKISPGHSWQLKDYQLAHFFPDSLSVSGTAACTFDGIEMHQNQKCAVISTHLEISARALFNNTPSDYTVGANNLSYRRLDTLVDSESVTDGQMTLKSSMVSNGVRTNMELSGPFHSALYSNDVTNMPGIGRRELRNVPIAMLARFGAASSNISPGDVWARSW